MGGEGDVANRNWWSVVLKSINPFLVAWVIYISFMAITTDVMLMLFWFVYALAMCFIGYHRASH